MLLRLACLTAAVIASASASSCGDSAIPYSFEVLPDGQPVLGCARPSCFGWFPTGQPATASSGSFYRVNGRHDGFFRQDRTEVSPYDQNDPRYYTPQVSVCEQTYASASCPGVTQWIGGIAPLLNVSAYSTTLQCCSYAPLERSEDRGVAVVGGGQIVVGGEVLSPTGQQYAFDYIADLAKVIKPDQSVYYEVSVRRMECAPLPEDAGTQKKAKPNAEHKAFAFQAPTFGGGRGSHHGSGSKGSHGSRGSHSHGSKSKSREHHSGSGSHEHGSHGSHEHVTRPPVQEPVTVVEEIIIQQPGVQLPPAQPPVVQQPPIWVQQPAPPVYYQPNYYYPVYGTGYYEMCFSGDMEVQTQDGPVKRMDELEKGDYVLTSNGYEMMYAPVSFWLHRVPSRQADFNLFELANGKTIKITSHHYIYKGDCSFAGGNIPFDQVTQDAVFAEEVKEGDCLYTASEDGLRMEESRVVKASIVSETGIYAPMTENGRIVVNGVYSSCHNVVPSHAIQHTFFEYVDAATEWYYSIFGGEADVTETPSGLSTLIGVIELIIPKGLTSF